LLYERDRNFGTEIQINATRVEQKSNLAKLTMEELEILEDFIIKADGELPKGDIIECEFIEST